MNAIFNVGDMVNYHSIIGGEVSSANHQIKAIQLEPNNFGGDVAWISGKSGCVSLETLSNEANPMKPYEEPKKLTRSAKRYQEYLRLDCNESYAEWMGFA